MEIEQVNSQEANEVKRNLSNDNYFVAEIDGKKINTLEEYMKEIIRIFHFPEGLFKNFNNFDSYDDWMTDLSWLSEKGWVDKRNKGYVLFIYNFDEMMKDDPKIKNKIIYYFEESIIPFWQDEVEHVVVDGKTKIFKVFIVKNR
ncbi:barstar family protein [Enterococcus faecalis]|nr:barstar family protein [Enterococcus faecalis]